MSGRGTAILALLALSLAAFVYFYELRGEPGRARARESQLRVFPGLEAGDIDELLVMTSDGRATRAERRASQWQILEPVRFPGDDVTLEGMAQTLAQLTGEDEIEEPGELEIYGLGDDTRELRFHTAHGEYALRVGSKTPVGDNVYVAGSGPEMAGDRVYTAPRWRADALEHSLDELRDRRVLRFERSAVERIEIGWPGVDLTLVKVAQGSGQEGSQEGEPASWRLAAPVQEPADAETVEDLLSQLSSLQAEGFVDEPSAADEAGLAEPAFRVTLHGAEAVGRAEAGPAPLPESVRARLALGAETGGRRRLARGMHTALYVVSAARVAELPRTLTAYRFKQLSSFNPERAQGLDLVFQPPDGESATLRLRREGADWRLDSAGADSERQLDTREVDRLVAELAHLEATRIVAELLGSDELSALGLGPARVEIRVLGARSQQGEVPVLAAVSLGGADSGTGVFARAAGRDVIYVIDGDLGDRLPLSHQAFRTRFQAPGQAGRGDGTEGGTQRSDEDSAGGGADGS